MKSMHDVRRAAAISVLLALGTALPAQAQTPGSDRRIAATDAREAQQTTRIDAGVANGSINANEATRLQNQQTRIDGSADRLAADGQYSRRDHARVASRQNAASRNIGAARRNRR
jgi:hypothetical protein